MNPPVTGWTRCWTWGNKVHAGTFQWFRYRAALEIEGSLWRLWSCSGETSSKLFKDLLRCDGWVQHRKSCWSSGWWEEERRRREEERRRREEERRRRTWILEEVLPSCGENKTLGLCFFARGHEEEMFHNLISDDDLNQRWTELFLLIE